MSTPLRRVKLNSQPHAPRVCFALHKARFPFSQEATGLLTNLGGPCRHAIARRRCKWSALSGENGRGRGARTPDLRFWRPPLYQLSYTPSRPPHPGRSVRTGKAWRLYGARARLASAKSVFLTTNQCASTCAAHAARILGSSPRMTTEEKRDGRSDLTACRAVEGLESRPSPLSSSGLTRGSTPHGTPFPTKKPRGLPRGSLQAGRPEITRRSKRRCRRRRCGRLRGWRSAAFLPSRSERSARRQP